MQLLRQAKTGTISCDTNSNRLRDAADLLVDRSKRFVQARFDRYCATAKGVLHLKRQQTDLKPVAVGCPSGNRLLLLIPPKAVP